MVQVVVAGVRSSEFWGCWSEEKHWCRSHGQIRSISWALRPKRNGRVCGRFTEWWKRMREQWNSSVGASLPTRPTHWCKNEWPLGPWEGGGTKASVSLLTTGLGADTYLLVKMTIRYCINMVFLFSFDLYSLTTKQEHDVLQDQWSNQMQ